LDVICVGEWAQLSEIVLLFYKTSEIFNVVEVLAPDEIHLLGLRFELVEYILECLKELSFSRDVSDSDRHNGLAVIPEYFSVPLLLVDQSGDLRKNVSFVLARDTLPEHFVHLVDHFVEDLLPLHMLLPPLEKLALVVGDSVVEGGEGFDYTLDSGIGHEFVYL